MPNETKSDDELANGFERILESEHSARLIWMRATGKSYEEAVATFEQAKTSAVEGLVREAVQTRRTQVAAAACTCSEYRFPEQEREQLKAMQGRHHPPECPQHEKI